MYSEDPRNRKAPSLILGFIAITGALILALFLTGILKANADDLIDPPHDPMFNNIVFITMKNDYMYVGGDTVIDMYEGASDGQYAQVWKSNFVQAINNFFSYVPKEQCFIVVASDGASANYMTSIREVLTSVSANYWSGSQDGNFEANDFSGYEDLYAPAGMYNVRYKSRLVKYLPVSPSPTPTPDPSVTSSFGFLGYFTYSSMYYYVEVSGSNIFKSVELDIYNTDVSAAMSEVGTTDSNTIAGKSVYMNNTFNTGSSINWTGPYAYLYFTGDNITVKVYRMSSSLISDDVDYIKANYNYVTLNGSNTENSSYPWFTLYSVNELNCLVINYNYYRNTGSYNMINKYGNNIDVLESYSSSSLSYSNSVQLRKAYGALLTRSEDPVPTQDPDVSPSPTPTEAPHVIINWPSGTPTPTPPFSVPGNSGTGSGSSGSGSLSPGQIDSTLDTFKTYTENNNAFAFLYACTSVIPDEALYFLFILLFILLLLACIRLFVHFTG